MKRRGMVIFWVITLGGFLIWLVALMIATVERAGVKP